MGYQFIGTPVPTPMFANAISNATVEEIKNLEEIDIWNKKNKIKIVFFIIYWNW